MAVSKADGKNDKLQGKLTNTNTAVYDNTFEGQGKLVYANGDVYEGNHHID